MFVTSTVLAVGVGLASAGTSLWRPSVRWLERNYRHARELRAVIGGAGAALAASVGVDAVVPGRSELAESVALVSAAVLVVCAVLLPMWQRRPAVTLRPRRILAVGAHPDDLELACGATLAKLVDDGHEVRTVVMSNGASGGHASRRVEEARRGSMYLGTSAPTVHAFCDTRLDVAEGDMVVAIEQAVVEFRPDLILTHSPNDFHQDHAAVFRATMRAARKQPAILCFESPSVTARFDPVFFVDVSGYVGTKVHAIGLHADQRHKPYMGGSRAAATATFRGAQARLAAAEGFEVVRMHASAVGEL